MNNEERRENCANNNLVYSTQFSEPALYQVVVHNDDFKPMEFVVGILENYFHMDRRAAVDKMLEAHLSGKTVCGVFSKDIAETKVLQVMNYVTSNNHPLQCDLEVA